MLAEAGLIATAPACYIRTNDDGTSTVTQFSPMEVGKIRVQQVSLNRLKGTLGGTSCWTLTIDELPENVFDDMLENFSPWLRECMEASLLVAPQHSIDD